MSEQHSATRRTPKSRKAPPRVRKVTSDNLRSGELTRGRGRSLVETAGAVMQSPVFRAVADAMPLKAGRGATSTFPPAIILLYAVLSRYQSSHTWLDRELRNIVTWRQVTELAAVHLELELPGVPIQYSHLRHYRNRYVTAEASTGLAVPFRSSSIELATSLGCFTDHGPDHNWLEPSLGNCIYGDGTIMKPYSDVELVEITDTATGEVLQIPGDSRAHNLNLARVAREVTKNKKPHGPNFGRLYVAVHVMAPTVRTGVVLDLRAALGNAEMKTGVPMLLALCDLLERRVDAVIWDGGAAADVHRELLSHGVPLVNSPPRRRKPAVKVDKKRKPSREDTTPFQLSLPVVSHDTRGGQRCPHSFIIEDGGAVYETHPQTDGSVDRGEVVPATDLIRTHNGPGFRWQLVHRLDCPNGPLTFTLDPSGEVPSTSAGGRARAISHLLRVIPDQTKIFPSIYGTRNDAEGFFGWHKSTLKNERAHALHPDHEAFEFLCSAILKNSLAWYEFIHLAD